MSSHGVCYPDGESFFASFFWFCEQTAAAFAASVHPSIPAREHHLSHLSLPFFFFLFRGGLMDGGSFRMCVGGVGDSSFDPAACCQKLPEIEETVGHN